MIVNIPPNETDDPAFLTALNGMLLNMVASYKPEEVFFVRIDRWFDHKWLRYSGKDLVPVWKNKLTFPPFNPNRILQQLSFRRFDGVYRETPDAPKPHRLTKSPSSENLQNRVENFSRSGLFFWFSSNTAQVDHASAMSYSIDKETLQSWFVSFRKHDGLWKIKKVKGIAAAELSTWFPPTRSSVRMR